MITILMATYNGEKYLRAQLDSLLRQTVDNFRLVIRDDCSTDGTLEVAREYERRFPQKIIVEQSGQNTGNAKYNFFDMMIRYKDDYVMLCDQDDVWLETKIEDTLAAMKAAERKHGALTPVLVHTDLTVVDSDLNVISSSFRVAMISDYHRTALHYLLIQNTVTGCTVMYNRSLGAYITETPSFSVMHDWWLVLAASAFGVVKPMEKQTILYRQHEDNSIGAAKVNTLRYKIHRLLHGGDIKKAISDTYLQAESFLNMYRDKLSPEQAGLIEEYCRIPLMNKLMRCITICRLKTLKHGFSRKLANFLFV